MVDSNFENSNFRHHAIFKKQKKTACYPFLNVTVDHFMSRFITFPAILIFRLRGIF